MSSDENAVRDNFIAGQSAFAVNWLFQYSDSNDASKSKIVGQTAFAPMPVFQAGADAGVKGSSVDGSSSFAIMATTPYPDQTWKFLTYLASNEVQTKYSAEMLPIWKGDFEGQKLEELKAATPPTRSLFRRSWDSSLMPMSARPSPTTMKPLLHCNSPFKKH